MQYRARFPYVEPLLTGRSARVLYTQSAPRLAGWVIRGDLFWRWINHAVLRPAGFDQYVAKRSPVQMTPRQSFVPLVPRSLRRCEGLAGADAEELTAERQ